MNSIFAKLPAMKYYAPSLSYQRGVSLMELMVGIVIGLLVVAVAMGALMVSRQVGGTVSDVSDIQQQAAYAMRVIGQQVRQVGVKRLALYRDALGMKEECQNDIVCPVAVIDEQVRRKDSELWSFEHMLSDVDSRGPRMIFINVKDLEDNDVEKNVWSANCLGDITKNGAVYNHFVFKENTLTCASSSSGNPESRDYQPVLRNVADFTTRYIMHDPTDNGQQKIKYMEARDVQAIKGWDRIQGIEICLTLFGKERIAIPDGATYQGCTGPERYETITDNERRDRLHLTFRSVFQLRGQGKPKKPPLPM